MTSRERFELDWTPPTATETAPIREALEANRKRRNEIDRKRSGESAHWLTPYLESAFAASQEALDNPIGGE